MRCDLKEGIEGGERDVSEVREDRQGAEHTQICHYPSPPSLRHITGIVDSDLTCGQLTLR